MEATLKAHRSVGHRSRRQALSTVLPVFAALMLLLLLPAAPALANLPVFPDVPTTHPHYVAITDLVGRHIVNGYTNGNFGPSDPVTRQQFAKMIVLSAGYAVGETDIAPFTDVDVSGPASLYPDNFIAVADALDPGQLTAPPTTFSGTAGWGTSSTHSPSARRAEYNGLLAGLSLSILDPWGNMSRAEVAQVLHNLLTIHSQDLGGFHTSAASAISRTVNRLDVFTLGQDNGLWHSEWNGSEWSSWAPHGGGPLTYEPAAVSWGINRMDVFARGQDGAIWHIALNGAVWSGWEWLGGILPSDPGAVSWGADRLDVFLLGPGATLLHRWWDGAWRP